MTRKYIPSSFDVSGSQYVFIGLTNDVKTFGTDGVCEFVIDIINNVSTSNLPDALLQIETMANQHQVKVIHKDKNKKVGYGMVFDKNGTLQKCNHNSLIESVTKRINKYTGNLMAFSYFLFVVLSKKQILSDAHKSLTMLDISTAKSTIDSCRYIKKEDIPPGYIEPIVSILKSICTIVHVKSSSVLLVIDIVYGFASTDVLMKIIDECKNQYGGFPLYVQTDIFQWKNLLLRMNKENNALLSRIVKQLDREMLVELLLSFILTNNNEAVKQFEHVLNSRNCEAVTRYGQTKELHNVLSTWESTAIFNFQPSKKFINETERAILSCISKESVVSKNEFKLLLKVLSDDNLFLATKLQSDLIENLSRSKTAYSANSLELLIAMLNHENLTASEIEISQFILLWFRSGLELKQVQKCEKDDSRIISRTYLRLRDIMQTKYVREQDDVMCLLEHSVFEFIKQFKFKAVAKVLHEVDDSDVQGILVAHITKLLRKGCFGHDVNAIIQDFCENDVLNVTKR
ncbi:unnamed protein product [Mytilus coruscus]|uniref:Uncharacterized protein n=1 Tax=Mytilus coruscus TaxID=42192 RepID=A0A6J8D3U8_MYTCO|nr:unnamed protein product [Mytilus coruscus]